jgi:hypothetical protein
VIHWQDADSIMVIDSLTNINIGLVPVLSPGLTHVSGNVTASNGGTIAGGWVVARTTDGSTVGYGISDGTGSYSMDAVPTGQLTIQPNNDDPIQSSRTIKGCAEGVQCRRKGSGDAVKWDTGGCDQEGEL